jgi:hypothetical protein
MSTVTTTYKTCAETARATYDEASAELAVKIAGVEGNIKSLSDLTARPYEEIKDQLKILNQEMLTYYAEALPAVNSARDAGLRAIGVLQISLAYLSELPPLSEQNIEHLARFGVKERDQLLSNMESLETIRKEIKEELTQEIQTLRGLIQKIDSLPKPFMNELENALKVQAQGEGTASFFDAAWGVASYVYINKALAARAASPAEPAATESGSSETKVEQSPPPVESSVRTELVFIGQDMKKDLAALAITPVDAENIKKLSYTDPALNSIIELKTEEAATV